MSSSWRYIRGRLPRCFTGEHWLLHLGQESAGLGQLPISPDCVFDASLVPGTCPGRFLDLKGLINKFLESRVIVQVVLGRFQLCGLRVYRDLGVERMPLLWFRGRLRIFEL